MKNHEYILFNGSAIQISTSKINEIKEKNVYSMPSFNALLMFNNTARFLADTMCIHDMGQSTMLTVNYGTAYDILKDRDLYHEYYSLFVHKNYPLIIHDRILLTPGRVDVVVPSMEETMDPLSPQGHPRIASKGPGEGPDTCKVQVIRVEENSRHVKIMDRKDHRLGAITAPHRSIFSAEEMSLLEKAGCADTAYGLHEAWDGMNDDDQDDLPWILKEYYRSAKGKVLHPEYSSAITGCFSMYDVEIDCAGLHTDGSWGVLFENIFHVNVCLARDFPEYLEDNADYWVESSVMKDLVQKEFNIRTSLLLPRITPESDGKVRLKVVNKLARDARSDHGWYM